MPGQNDSHHSESEEKAASERSADYRSHRIDRALKTAIGGTTEEEEEKEHNGILAVGRSASERGRAAGELKWEEASDVLAERTTDSIFQENNCGSLGRRRRRRCNG